MKKHNQLCLGLRYQIQSLLEVGLLQMEIADQIGVHKSTISHELKRNVLRRGQTAGRYIGKHT
jgi:IS30 family transposase